MGLLDAEAAFTDGDFDAEGSMRLIEQFPQIFQYPQPEAGGGVNPELDMIMMGMPLSFNSDVAGDLEATIQFILGGAGGGMYHLRIKEGQCAAYREPAVDATLTINASAETWLAIAKGEIDGQEAFMAGKYRATGDMNIMMKMGELFVRATHSQPPTLSSQDIPSDEPNRIEQSHARNASPLPQPPSPVSQSPTPDSHPAQEAPPMIDRSTLNFYETISGMPTAFNAEAAGDMTADIQFDVSGDEPGTYYLHIENGACIFNEGPSPAATLTINTPSGVWLAVSRGEMDGQMAFMQQKYTVQGDFSLLMKMNQLFES